MPMEVIKTLWTAVQKDPHFMRRVNGWLTVFWIAMIPVSIMMGWLSSIATCQLYHSGRSSPVIGRRGKQLASR